MSRFQGPRGITDGVNLADPPGRGSNREGRTNVAEILPGVFARADGGSVAKVRNRLRP